VVDYLERRYPEFDGLNLTFEVREGILKHHSDYDNPQLDWELGLGGNPSLECQIVNLADEIAYNCHDVDDGLASGVLNEAQLSGIEIWQEHLKYVTSQFPEADEQMRRHTMVRRLINHLVTDLTEQAEKNIASDTPKSPEDVKKGKRHLIIFSETIARQSVQLKLFLYQNMYRHYRMVRMSEKAKRIISELFKAYMDNIDILPDHIKSRMDNELRHVVVADYIAGMTDRFAGAEYKKLIDPFEKV
jgi:dGTPase